MTNKRVRAKSSSPKAKKKVSKSTSTRRRGGDKVGKTRVGDTEGNDVSKEEIEVKEVQPLEKNVNEGEEGEPENKGVKGCKLDMSKCDDECEGKEEGANGEGCIDEGEGAEEDRREVKDKNVSEGQTREQDGQTREQDGKPDQTNDSGDKKGEESGSEVITVLNRNEKMFRHFEEPGRVIMKMIGEMELHPRGKKGKVAAVLRRVKKWIGVKYGAQKELNNVLMYQLFELRIAEEEPHKNRWLYHPTFQAFFCTLPKEFVLIMSALKNLKQFWSQGEGKYKAYLNELNKLTEVQREEDGGTYFEDMKEMYGRIRDFQIGTGLFVMAYVKYGIRRFQEEPHPILDLEKGTLVNPTTDAEFYMLEKFYQLLFDAKLVELHETYELKYSPENKEGMRYVFSHWVDHLQHMWNEHYSKYEHF